MPLKYLKATKLNERKRSSTNGVFTGLMDLLYLVILIVAIMMTKNGEDALPYILFFITALGKLYSNLNSLVRLIDMSERFKTSKKQLDEYFKDSKEIKIIKVFNEIKPYIDYNIIEGKKGRIIIIKDWIDSNFN